MGVLGENRKKNKFMLTGPLKKNGFDLWRHSFTAFSKKSGKPQPFFIELYIVNPALSPKNISFDKPCFVMLKVGCWGENSFQLHKFFAIEDVKINKRKLDVRCESFMLTETEFFGSVEVPLAQTKAHPEYLSSSGTMSWKIKMDKKIAFEPKKTDLSPKTFWYVQGAKTLFGGSIILNGEEFAIVPKKSFGHADKIWGKDFPSQFLYLSSCNLASQISGNYLSSSCFDVCGKSTKDGKMITQIFFYHQNQCYDFSNTGMIAHSKIKTEFSENDGIYRWTISAENSKNMLDADIFCKKTEMLKMKYITPKGKIAFSPLWSGGNGYGEIRLYKKVNKDLETIEQAKIENCACEYGCTT